MKRLRRPRDRPPPRRGRGRGRGRRRRRPGPRRTARRRARRSRRGFHERRPQAPRRLRGDLQLAPFVREEDHVHLRSERARARRRVSPGEGDVLRPGFLPRASRAALLSLLLPRLRPRLRLEPLRRRHERLRETVALVERADEFTHAIGAARRAARRERLGARASPPLRGEARGGRARTSGRYPPPGPRTGRRRRRRRASRRRGTGEATRRGRSRAQRTFASARAWLQSSGRAHGEPTRA